LKGRSAADIKEDVDEADEMNVVDVVEGNAVVETVDDPKKRAADARKPVERRCVKSQ
jgi:hypothetical protein